MDELLSTINRYPSIRSCTAGGDYLITGGAGLIGSQIAGLLTVLREKRADIGEIYILDSFAWGASPLADYLLRAREVRMIRADITQPLSGMPRVKNVIHAASIPSPFWFGRDPMATVLVNTVGTVNVLNYAVKSGSSRVMHVSSSGVYGNLPGNSPWSEEMIGFVDMHDRRACYDESKRVAETICADVHRNRGIPVTVIRPFNAYGPGQRADDGRVIPHLVEEAMRGGPLRLETDGTTRRCFCYVLDLAAAMLLATGSDAPWEVFNVGSTEPVSMVDLAVLVCETFGLDRSCVLLNAMHSRGGGSGPSVRLPLIAAIDAAFGWQPSIPIADGIRRTARYHELMRTSPES